jgi:thymidine phosphorylase
MDVPLGRAAGNWLEVKESVECLDPQPGAGRITLPINDLRDLVLDCAAHLLLQTGSIGGRTALSECAAFDAARKQAENCLTSGAPRKKWDEMLAAQGADLEALNRKLALDHTAPAVIELKADKSGFVSRCDARLVGEVVRHLGGGRFTKESAVNYDVGLDRIIKPGEKIAAGEPLARVHAADASSARSACEQLNSAFEIADQPPALPPLIAGIIERV